MHIHNVMFGGVPARPTGLAMSVLRRAQAFARVGHTIEILIQDFSPTFEDSMRTLNAEGALVADRIRLRSMHKDFAGVKVPNSEESYVSPLGSKEDGWEYIQDTKRSDIWRGSQNGEYKHFVWMRGDKVSGIDLISNGKRFSRTWYDFAGRLCKVEQMNANNKPHLIEYIDHAGNTYMQETKTPENGATTNIALHSPEGIRNFANQAALVDLWFHDYVFKDVHFPTVISEYGFHRASLQKLERQNQATVIYTFHNNHHVAPYGVGAPLRPEQRDFFEHIKEYKAIVLLTEEQSEDILSEYGPLENIYVIPHHMPGLESQIDRFRDPNRILMLGRFDTVKGHEEVFDAFTKVLARHPSATLDLYGRGSEEARLRALATAMGIEKSVRFCGFTANAFHEFSGAAVSVVASAYEGFCLSLAESMVAGCVPVTWNFKYGPRDLVNDGTDGIIVPKGDTAAMAEAILRLIGDPIQREKMSNEARKISQRLNEADLLEAWTRLFSEVRAR